MTMVHRGWIRVYFRDRFKVFRALPGVEVLNDGDLIFPGPKCIHY